MILKLNFLRAAFFHIPMYCGIGFLVFIGVFSTPVHAAPLLKIVSPTSGQTVFGHEITVSFLVGNAIFGSETHLHLWLDTSEYSHEHATEIMSHFDHVISDIPQGIHTLTLEAVKPDHTSFEQSVRETVSFTVQIPKPQPKDVTDELSHPFLSFISRHIWSVAGGIFGIAGLLVGLIFYQKAAST